MLKPNLKIIFCLLAVSLASQLHAEVLSYSGRLVNATGVPVTGSPSLKFDVVYSGDTSNIICTKTISTPLANGVFHVNLDFSSSDCGSKTLLERIDEIPSGQSLVYQVTDVTVPASPKPYGFQPLSSVPLSLVAKLSKTISDHGATDGQVLKWNAATKKWLPASASAGSGTLVDLSAGAGITVTPVDADTYNVAITNGGVGTTQLADSSVNSAKIVDGSILGSDIANTTIPYAKLNIADADIPAAKINGFEAAARAAISATSPLTYVSATGVLDIGTVPISKGGTGRTNSTLNSVVVTDVAGNYQFHNCPDGQVIVFTGGAPSCLTPSTTDSTKLPLAGGTMTGNIDMNAQKIVNLTNPSAPQEAATKDYVDSTIAGTGVWSLNSGNVYRSSGRVGIGTSTPESALHVKSPTTFPVPIAKFENNDPNSVTIDSGASLVHNYSGVTDQRYILSSNSVNNGGPAGHGYGGLFLGSGSAHSAITSGGGGVDGGLKQLFFWTNADFTSPKMKITGSGLVGIGTNSPNGKLDVKGSIVMSGATSGYTGFIAPATNTGNTVWTLPAADGSSGQVLSTNGAGVLSWTTASGGSSVWSLNGSNAYYNAGNVGIGTTTPSKKFEVVGEARFQNGYDTDGTRFDSGSAGYGLVRIKSPNGQGGRIEFADGQSGWAWDTRIFRPSAGTLRVEREGSNTATLSVGGSVVMSGSTSGIAGFQAPATAGNNIWTLPSGDGATGQVLSTNGAGVLSWINPAAGGGGDFLANGTVPMTGDLRLNRYIYGGNSGNAIDTGASATQTLSLRTSDADIWFRTINNNNILFTTNSNERMRINPSGNIGVGTTTPNGKLDVKGSIVMSGATSGFTGFLAPATNTGNTVWTLPSADGTSGQVLSTNGSGVLTWATSAGGDNLGNHTATQALQLGSNLINNNGGSNGLSFDTAGRATIQTSSGSLSAGLTLTNSSPASGSGSELAFRSQSVQTAGIATSLQGAPSDSDLIFSTRGSNSLNERMRITSTGNAQFTGSLLLKGSVSGTAGFQAAATAGSTVWTLPMSDGTSGQVLSTNGAGVLSWVSASAGSGDFKADGSVSMSGQLKALPGAGAAPGISFAGDTDTGFSGEFANSIRVLAGGTVSADFQNNWVGFFGGNPAIEPGAIASNKFYADYSAGSSAGNVSFGNATTNGIFFPATNTIGLSTSGTERLRVLSNGNVGIGSSSPSRNLEVRSPTSGTFIVGNTTPTGNPNSQIRLENFRSSFGDGNPSIVSYIARGTSASPSPVTSGMTVLSLQGRGYAESGFGSDRSGATIDFVSATNWGNSNVQTDMIFKTAGTGNWDAMERMRITANGNVGIGTSTPNHNLSVYNSGATTSNIESGGAGSTAYQRFAGLTAGSSSQAYLSGLNISNSNGAYEIYDQTAGASRLWISAGGNIGVGTVTPSEKLEVSGSVKATAFISTSDLRLKKNIQVVDGLPAILQLRGVSYEWRSDGSLDMGVIAQETEKVFPWAVATDKVTGYKAVKYNSLVAPLIEAVRDLDQRDKEISRKIASIEEENATLKKKNAELESLVFDLAKRLKKLESAQR